MAFMVPETAKLDAQDAREFNHTSDCEPDCTHEPGWYARLQAPGYLDATDWIGPYASHEEALAALVEQYDLCVACQEEPAADGEELCPRCEEEAGVARAEEAEERKVSDYYGGGDTPRTIKEQAEASAKERREHDRIK